MGIKVAWHNAEETVVRLTMQQSWSWDDFDNAMDEAFALIRSTDHIVHLIVDDSHGGPPPTFDVGCHFQRVLGLAPGNVGEPIVVNPNPLILKLSEIRRIFTGRWKMPRFVKSLEEVDILLAQLELER